MGLQMRLSLDSPTFHTGPGVLSAACLESQKSGAVGKVGRVGKCMLEMGLQKSSHKLKSHTILEGEDSIPSN